MQGCLYDIFYRCADSTPARSRLENLKSDILDSKDCPNPRFSENFSWIQGWNLGSGYKAQYPRLSENFSWIHGWKLGSGSTIQDLQKNFSWIQGWNLGSGSKTQDPRFSENFSWIQMSHLEQDFSPGSKNSFLKILDLGSWIRISSLTGDQTWKSQVCGPTFYL